MGLPALLSLFLLTTVTRADLPGTWELLVPNAGIASMHTAVTHYNTVILLDRTNIGPTKELLPNSHCRIDPNDTISKKDTHAHSMLFNPQTNTLRPLMILTDTWCSSGQFLADGTLLQTGGDLDGWKKIRKFKPCRPNSTKCDWIELRDVELINGRWYATNQILPDGSIIIIGGKGTNTIEFYPPREEAIHFPFLVEVADRQGDNLYPYVHLLPNGHLFIFANTRAVLYDYEKNIILKNYPTLHGGPRNYPSAGSSAMLALENDHSRAVILICGGAKYGAYIKMETNEPAHGSCGRIVATADNPVWEMEDMPIGRIMGDMVMLPTGDILIINGAKSGTQGFELAANPCLNPVLYRPEQPLGLRFMVLKPGTIPRMYHSTANLLPDGRVLLAGSNPHYFYNFKDKYPTELRIEAFWPEYLDSDKKNVRPFIVDLKPGRKVKYGERIDVYITVELPVVGMVEMNLGNAPFATHSFSQGQRLVKLKVGPALPLDGAGGSEGGWRYRVCCWAPRDGKIAPPGYYMLFAVNHGVPSVARWIRLVI